MESPVMEIAELVKNAERVDCSDIHVAVNHPPILRVHGEMIPLRVMPMTYEQVSTMVFSIMNEKQRSDFEKHHEVDFAIFFNTDSRFRVNVYTTNNGISAVMRRIPTSLKSFADLRIPEKVRGFCSLTKGLILITGATGSGKTTTLSAMVDHINHNYSKHIITLEDPIEFVHKSDRSLINQREVGVHTANFTTGIRSSLRENPDVIMVGEMRDIETISAALTAAETGHLVFGTLHTNSAAQTVDRIIDIFPSEDKAMIRTMLASSLEGVVSQRLARTTDGSGRVAAYEILIVNTAVRNLIRENKIPQIQSIMQVGTKQGMRLMKDSVYELINAGTITEAMGREMLNIGVDAGEHGGGAGSADKVF
jgi:twitching motility protein PilT